MGIGPLAILTPFPVAQLIVHAFSVSLFLHSGLVDPSPLLVTLCSSLKASLTVLTAKSLMGLLVSALPAACFPL